MVREVCCVCDAPIEGEVNTLGGRTYCARHCAMVSRENRAAASPILFEVGAVVIFAAIVAALVNLLNPTLSGFGLVLAGIVIAVVPAAFWLLAFYRQDRLEPEPKHMVFGTFLLGAILAAGIGQPVIREFFGVQDWLYASPLVGILGSILIVGFVQEFLKYAAIRYSVFNATEFDERVDGIIYGAAAGLGYATMLNIGYVVGNNGVDLGFGAIQVAITALAHASFTGVTGYFLGRAKFECMGPLWLPMGLSLAAVLNGVVSYLLSRAPLLGSGLDYNPWYGIIVAGVVAAVTFAALFAVIRRLNAATVAAARRAS